MLETASSEAGSPIETRNCASARAKRPVFVMGCHRSGTNLMYDTLLSSGGFAIYQGYMPIHKTLVPRVGSFKRLENRQKALRLWLRSKGFRKSGLDSQELSERVLRDCRNAGDFIRLTMDEIARRQNVNRWAVYDPDAVLHVPRIKADIPEALFVHIVRDGRDIAVTLNKMGGFRPLPWHSRSKSLLATALYWQWAVRKGRSYGHEIPGDYIEVHYEDLVADPRATLSRLGEFLHQDLDYERIQRTGLGRLRETNSSFRHDAEAARENPVGRWKLRLSPKEIAMLEAAVGDCLEEFGYSLSTAPEDRKLALQHQLLTTVYPAFLSGKLWLRINTPLGRFSNLSALELDPDATADGNASHP